MRSFSCQFLIARAIRIFWWFSILPAGSLFSIFPAHNNYQIPE
jgi:hypothetical protein